MEEKTCPDITLVIDRDNNGYITRVEYTINNPGEDRKNVLDFIELCNFLTKQEPEPIKPDEK